MQQESNPAKYRGLPITIFMVILAVIIPILQVSAEAANETGHPLQIILDENNQLIPTWEPPITQEYIDNRVIIYRSDTTEGEKRNDVDDCKSCGPAYTDFYNPNSVENTSSPLTDSTATSEILNPPITWPQSTTIKLITSWPNGSTTHCSGTLIQSGYVLTAAHCIYTHQAELCSGEDNRCLLQDMQIFSQYYLGDSDWEETSFTEILTFTAWTENRDFNYDLAAIELFDPLGEESKGVGWLGIGYQNNLYFEDKPFAHTSFQVSESNNTDLHLWLGELQSLDVHQLNIEMQAVDGQGGAGLIESGGNHILFGVLSHQSEDLLQTGFTRLTNGKFTAIRDWMNIESKDFNQLYYFPLMVR